MLGEWPPLPDELIAELRQRPRVQPLPQPTEKWAINYYHYLTDLRV